MTELKEREVALKEKELDALVRKQADAEKYAAEVKAEAEKIVRKQQAEADLIEAENSVNIASAVIDGDLNLSVQNVDINDMSLSGV